MQSSSLLSLFSLRRKVFFSFHFEDDIFEVNQVRNSWRFRPEEDVQGVFIDASIWESRRFESEDSLKRLIRDEIENTSVTCVLAGRQTYERRWVRYEIARSVAKRNGLLTVRLEGLKKPRGLMEALQLPGPDPLGHMGLFLEDDGSVRLIELSPSGQWQYYHDYREAVRPPASWSGLVPGQVSPLTRWCTSYDYAIGDGYNNLSLWIGGAAASVGR